MIFLRTFVKKGIIVIKEVSRVNNKIIYVAGFVIIAIAVIGTLAWGSANGKNFDGADDNAKDAANRISGKVVEPWTNGIWGDYKLPSETESLLFAFQAAIGAMIIGYFIGRHVTKKRETK